MGHIAHLRNNLNQKARLRMPMIKLIKRKKTTIIYFLRIEWSLFINTSSSVVKIGPMGLEKKIFKFGQCIFAISKLSPLSRFLEIGSRVLKYKILKFCLFGINSPWKWAWHFHLINLGSPSPNDALCQVWLKLAQWFWRRNFLNIFNIILHFHYNLSVENGVALHLKQEMFQTHLCPPLVQNSGLSSL